MKEVIIVTGNKYPCEDAGALRQHAMAKILSDLNYKVTIIGYGKSTNRKILQYDGIDYISFRPRGTNLLLRIIGRILFGFRALSVIKSRKGKVNVIFVVDILPIDFKRIEKYAKKKQIKLVHDSVEWYSPEEFNNGKKNIEYILKEITNTKIIKNQWRVIAISKYLENHFKSICKKTVRIPVIMDVTKIQYGLNNKKKEKRIFSYVGGPGKKDYLKELIEGFFLLDEKIKSLLELHIIGVSFEQLYTLCGIDHLQIEKNKKFLRVHGRLKHEDAIKWVMNSDFTLLLRDETLRYAQAGFPTKVVESLASGTPVICNLSSDLEYYLEDMKNSVLIKGHNSESVKTAIERAIVITNEEYIKMRKYARTTAENYFDYKIYCSQMKELLE